MARTGVDVQLGRDPGREHARRDTRCPRRGRRRASRRRSTPGAARRRSPPATAPRHRGRRRCRPGRRGTRATPGGSRRGSTPARPAMWLDALGVAVVDHRIDEELERDVDLAAIAGEDREPRGEPAARARARDRDARRVDAQLVGVLRGPQQARVAVVERRRVRVFRREPVLDRHRDAVELLDPAVEAGVDGEPGAEHVATTVDPVARTAVRTLASAASTRARSGRDRWRRAPPPRTTRSSSAAAPRPACRPSPGASRAASRT